MRVDAETPLTPAGANLLKLVAVGNMGVGMTSFVWQFTEQTPLTSNIATIGIDFKIRTVGFQGARCAGDLTT